MRDLIDRFYTRYRVMAADILLLNLCLMLSFVFRFEGGWLNYFNIYYIPFLSLAGGAIFYFSSLYERMWQYASIGELLAIIKTAAMVNALLMAYSFFGQTALPRSIPLINTVLLIFALGGYRFSLRLISDLDRQKSGGDGSDHPATKVLVVGAGDAGEMVIRELQRHPEINRRVVGIIDDDPGKQNLRIHGVEVLGDRHRLPEVISEEEVDEVIIAIPSAPGSEIREIYNRARDQDVRVRTLPGVYELIDGDASINQLREIRVEDLLRRDPVSLDIDSICSYLTDRTVLVTGGGGSIGSEICRQVAEYSPERLVILDIYENSTYMLQRELQNRYPDLDIHPVIASVCDERNLDNIFARYQPGVVFHAAAHKHVPLMESNPARAVSNNVFGTEKTALAAERQGVDKFVLISTDKAVNPTNVMGATKRVAEMVIQFYDKRHSTDYMAVRFGNVLGSCGSVVPIFKKQIARGGPVTVTHPQVERYFMTIPEAAQLVLQSGAQGGGGELFLLDMGEPVKILELARDLINLSGLRPGEDIEIEITGLRPGEKLREEMLTEAENNRATEHERIYVCNLENHLPGDLPSTLTELNQAVRSEGPENVKLKLAEIVEGYQAAGAFDSERGSSLKSSARDGKRRGEDNITDVRDSAAGEGLTEGGRG